MTQSRDPSELPTESLTHFGSHESHVQSWYVLARSKEVKAGKAVPKDFLGRKIAVYRGESGKVFALESRCSHLGAMLAAGDVIGDCIRCPFHHWTYDGEGQCVSIPYRDTVPARAKNRSYPVEEKYGLIWFFFGEKPLFPVPHFPGVEGKKPYLRPRLVVNTHPHLILPNSVDMNHWKVVHGIEVLDHRPAEPLDPFRLRHIVRGKLVDTPKTWAQSLYKLFGKKEFEWEWISWGGNTCTIDVTRPFKVKFMLTYVPLPGRSCLSQTVMYSPERSAFLRWTGLAKVLNAIDLAFSLLLFYDDMKIMRTIEFWPHFTKEDAMVAQWVKHIRSLSTFNPDAKSG